jgi:hypothetical protein
MTPRRLRTLPRILLAVYRGTLRFEIVDEPKMDSTVEAVDLVNTTPVLMDVKLKVAKIHTSDVSLTHKPVPF